MPGVWRAVAYSKGAAVIFHSPKACAHVTRTMDIASHYRAEARGEAGGDQVAAPLVSSLLSDAHSIFGGEDQLRKCIAFVVQTYKPQYIVIANSCVAGVIGDDVDAVAEDAEEEWKVPVLSVPCYGFLDGEYYAGYFSAAEKLIDRFMTPQETQSETVVLIGDHGGPLGAYAKEVTKLLSYFGLEVVGQFPSYIDYDQMKMVPSSSLNVILGGRTQTGQCLSQLTQKMQDRFGTPYYGQDYPIGWESTMRWLRGLGAMLHKEAAAEAAIEAERLRLVPAVEEARRKMGSKRVALCVGRLVGYFQPYWIMELLGRIGVEFLGVILLDGYEEKERQKMLAELRCSTDAPVYGEAEGNEILAQAELVLTTHEISSMQLKQLFLPMIPTVGVTGEIEFMRKMIRLLCRRGDRGGIVYG